MTFSSMQANSTHICLTNTECVSLQGYHTTWNASDNENKMNLKIHTGALSFTVHSPSPPTTLPSHQSHSPYASWKKINIEHIIQATAHYIRTKLINCSYFNYIQDIWNCTEGVYIKRYVLVFLFYQQTNENNTNVWKRS